MEQSLKFKILFELSNKKHFENMVPRYWHLNELKALPASKGRFILRSALKIENNRELNSGVGLSVKDIQTNLDLDVAVKRMKSLEDIDFCILQKQVEHEIHLTIFSTGGFDFIESISKEKEFDFIGAKTKSSKKPFMKPLETFLHKFRKDYEGDYIIEAGFSKNAKEPITLYQVNLVSNVKTKSLIHAEILNQALYANQKLQKNSLLNSIKIEIEAYRFRNKNSFNNFSDCFNNWIYLFYYFKLFCIQNKIEFGSSSFEKFLNLNGKGHIGKMAKAHLSISTKTLELKSWNINSFFDDQKEIFIGEGLLEFVVDKNVLVTRELEVSQIKNKEYKLILTSYDSILAHPALFCAEKSISLVGGLSWEVLEHIKEGDKISLDFNLRKISIKSI